ncbi:porin [Pararobbsia alpina]|uniref:Outer membrane porin protein n=1 Tax=Pararobbsia alpina TaxID=621374 RepID=A0A6S7BH09_9BURK|nr:Outer membrane porin protein [Pararobbsia alpina]
MLNKKVMGLAVIGSLSVSLAHAQNSVTLYGSIDAGLMYTNNVKHGATQGPLYQATSGNTNGSQFGIRGSEDLGGGVTAIFKLENGFSVQNGKLGQDGRLFGRQTYVGIRDDQWGTITLGRQYDEGIDYVAPLSDVAYDFGKTGFAHPFDNDNLDYSVRINNSVKFASSNFDGFKFGTLYGFSNSSEFDANRVYSVGASYGSGPLNVGVSYLQLDGSNSTNTTGAIDVAESTANGTGGFLLGADVQRVAAAGLNYTLGSAVVGFVYSHSEFEGTEAFGSAGGNLRFDNYEVNGKYSLTPSLKVGIGYTYTDGHVTDTTTYGADSKWNQLNAQVLYFLSKSTDVYLESMYQHVSGKNYVAFVNTSGGASSTGNQIVATVGSRTRF